MIIKTSELTGPALDWAVAKCEGVADTEYMRTHLDAWPYSSEWAQGGPIIDRYITKLEDYGDSWGAEGPNAPEQHGPTILIATMRCFVASRLGESVDIPEELL